jgi:hypothetical protein
VATKVSRDWPRNSVLHVRLVFDRAMKSGVDLPHSQMKLLEHKPSVARVIDYSSNHAQVYFTTATVPGVESAGVALLMTYLPEMLLL